MRFGLLTAAFALLAGTASHAGVLGVGPSGFQIQETARITAPAARVWAAIIKPGDWWDPEHSYSHNGANMTLLPVAGGCWCETWPGGSVEHMHVVFAMPQKSLRLRGGLGPLQPMGIEGAMTWTLTSNIDGSTTVSLDYAVGGYSATGFDGLSRAVDGVLASQLNRMQLFIQTGHPDAVATQ